MYDKVKLFVYRTKSTPDVLPYLAEGKEQTDIKTGEVCTFGCLDGLKVAVFVGGISITGSLSKFYHPNNIYPLDRHTTVKAMEKLEERLHLPLADAKVTGLEFGTQFVMSHPIESYLSKLGDAPRLQRLHLAAGSLYYKPRGKQQPKVIVFYDKQADAAAKGMILPDGFEGLNLLKYELRLNGRLPHQMGVCEVTASTLSDRGFYRAMVERYMQEYFAIHKFSQIKTDIMSEIKTVSDAFGVLVARLINQTDQSQISGFLDELREARVFEDRKSYTRLKKKIQETAAKANVTVCDELIRELDDEVKNVCAYQ